MSMNDQGTVSKLRDLVLSHLRGDASDVDAMPTQGGVAVQALLARVGLVRCLVPGDQITRYGVDACARSAAASIREHQLAVSPLIDGHSTSSPTEHHETYRDVEEIESLRDELRQKDEDLAKARRLLKARQGSAGDRALAREQGDRISALERREQQLKVRLAHANAERGQASAVASSPGVRRGPVIYCQGEED